MPSADQEDPTLRVPAESRLFDGHFEQDPVLPGVAQLAIALEMLVAREGRPVRLRGVKDVRFSHPVGPGATVQVRLSSCADPHDVRFEIRSGDQAVSSGVLTIARGDHDVH